jgi:hypothetical protein
LNLLERNLFLDDIFHNSMLCCNQGNKTTNSLKK